LKYWKAVKASEAREAKIPEKMSLNFLLKIFGNSHAVTDKWKANLNFQQFDRGRWMQNDLRDLNKHLLTFSWDSQKATPRSRKKLKINQAQN
jgi:hypothetical protein